MRSTQEIYREVGSACSSYSHVTRPDGFTDSASNQPSCLSCEHFSNNEYCVLDLYDKIEKNL